MVQPRNRVSGLVHSISGPYLPYCADELSSLGFTSSWIRPHPLPAAGPWENDQGLPSVLACHGWRYQELPGIGWEHRGTMGCWVSPKGESPHLLMVIGPINWWWKIGCKQSLRRFILHGGCGAEIVCNAPSANAWPIHIIWSLLCAFAADLYFQSPL